MKKLIGTDVGSYSFNASSQVITLSGLTNLKLEQILLITNVTTGDDIYMFNDHTLGGVLTYSAPNYILTLTYNTSIMSNSDSLMIYIDYGSIYVNLVDQNNNALTIQNSGALEISDAYLLPTGSTAVNFYSSASVSGSSYSDYTYVIPNGKILTITDFKGGSQGYSNDSKVELWYCTTPPLNATGSNGTIISFLYCGSNTFKEKLYEKYTGNGTRNITLRLKRLDGTTKEITGQMRGFIT